MKKILALVLSLMMILSLTACGGSDKYAGTYKVVSVTVQNTTIKKGDDLWKKAFSDESKLPYMKLDGKGKCTFLFDSETSEGEYSVDGEKITLKDSKESIDGKIKDNQITISAGGADMVFEKE
ncbi:MAG: hypothetical protein K6G64_01350 [Eubacterium sp.]|nr:hypothetical protein [Eubacterium sp.]